MVVNDIEKCMREEGWMRQVNYGGQVEYHRADWEFRLTIEAGYWDLRRANDDRMIDVASGETADELQIALIVIEALVPAPKPKRKPAARELECECRFSGDRADARLCEVHGGVA